MQAWGGIKDSAEYSGRGVRVIRTWLKKGLRHSRIQGGAILIKFSDIDEFLKKFEVNENKVDRIVDEALKDF